MAITDGMNPLKPSPIKYEFRYMSLNIAINGRNKTELVQSTRDRKNTRMKRQVLCCTPPIVVVFAQYADRRKDDAVPTNSNVEMQILSEICNVRIYISNSHYTLATKNDIICRYQSIINDVLPFLS